MTTSVDGTSGVPAAAAADTAAAGGGKFRIYTRTGDGGSAALYNGQRRPKDDAVFAALGDVDELNSALGLAGELLAAEPWFGGRPPVARLSPAADQPPLGEQLEAIQSRLLDVGSAVATPPGASPAAKLARVAFPAEATAQLEGWLDAMDDQLPPLRNFILPSGGVAAAQLHVARSVCRRAERSVVALVRDEAVDSQVGIYLNRLSDYLFTVARFAALKADKQEKIYKKAA